ncbi:sugar-binding transcriptional regulator [Nakamurella lactea]|uniref:sugar-binding transcriptional regulator n=1 Tax=Nakamurella lactea TaxID=459515 RepID=UPI000411A518|nr:sugar-binding domain-containing protein [Nakamurella lactea]
MGPVEMAQAAEIARMYYVEQLSKIEIAQRTGLSRFKVARILADGLAAGIVKITIELPDSLDADLAGRVGAAYGLQHVLVVRAEAATEDDLRRKLARAAADLLTEIVSQDDVLGVGWGRTLTAMAGFLTDLPSCPVVQMTGVTGQDMNNSMELVRQITSGSGGRAYPIFAPLLLPDSATAAGLRRQPDLAAATAQFGAITKAVVAIGSWDPPNSQLRMVMTPRERDELKQLGVQAELCSGLLDAEGRRVATEMNDRMIAVDVQQLHDIPELIAVAGGETKQRAVLAVLRSGLVNSLITDDGVAQFLLDQLPAEHPAPGVDGN